MVAGQNLGGRLLWVSRRIRQHMPGIKTGERALELSAHVSSGGFIDVSFAGGDVVHAAVR